MPFDQEMHTLALPLPRRKVDELAQQIADDANGDGHDFGDDVARLWLDKLIRRGASTAFLKELEDAASLTTWTFRLQLDRSSKSFHMAWESENYGQATPLQTLNALYALQLAQIVNAGVADRFKRCALKGCRRYFYGDPRRRWCSNNCGSIHRGRIKRKRDRNRQMIGG